MNTIENNIENTIIINKSKFITLLIKINNVNNVKMKIDEIKNIYKDATHYCYGYIVDNNKKASDDSEPNGTAGIPILSILEKNNLNNILCIVVRYYGGTKLGTGGLIRAYSRSVKEALNKVNIKEIINAVIVDLLFNYEDEKKIINILNNVIINDKIYNDKISYNTIIPINDLDNILEKLKDINIDIEIKDNVEI